MNAIATVHHNATFRLHLRFVISHFVSIRLRKDQWLRFKKELLIQLFFVVAVLDLKTKQYPDEFIKSFNTDNK